MRNGRTDWMGIALICLVAFALIGVLFLPDGRLHVELKVAWLPDATTAASP